MVERSVPVLIEKDPQKLETIYDRTLALLS